MNANIETKFGVMKFELFVEETPGTAQNFIKLIKEGFYDGLTFHRVIPGFVVQGGCPRGDGTGGPGYRIKCETSAPRQLHDRGVLSMAHAGKDTGGSQFFIVHSRNTTAHLDGVHTCFGKMTEGDEILSQIKGGDQMISVTLEETTAP
jgi:peptidyl-prolyl cis-trans isomerase B (cyclophilin B)